MHYKAQELGGKQKESQTGNACSSSVFSLAEFMDLKGGL